MTTDHVSSESLAAYLSRRAPPAEHAAVEAHLADCASCRDETVRAQRVLSRRRRPARITGMVAAAGLAAAVLLMIGVPTGEPESNIRPPDEFRGDAPISRVTVTAPADDAIVGDSGIVFRWASVGADRLYRISVLTEAGDRIWSGQTTDTSIALPPDRRLQAGSAYVWYVDAIGPAGDSVTSGPVPFGVR